MAKPEIDISLDSVGGHSEIRVLSGGASRSRIDIPLDKGRAGKGGSAILDQELEFVNRHHQQVKEQRRRAREET